MEIEELLVHNAKTGKFIVSIYGMKNNNTVEDIKKQIQIQKPKLAVARQEIRLEQKAKGLKDDESLKNLKLRSGDKIFVKDLGLQIGWSTVFLIEYAGPLAIYLWMSQRPWLFYGDTSNAKPLSTCAVIATWCYGFHYLKRILETLFVHRFSHGTMPIFNLFKNSSYYWGFTAYVAYHVNHPLFTPPCQLQTYIALGLFIISELGNGSIHLALRNLRPPGTKERKIPLPTSNPLTFLFNLVSCPNYTYETMAWISFTIMTQCLPAALFTFAGFYQMAIWALGKHRNYKREFPKYPKGRKAIIPFVL